MSEVRRKDVIGVISYQLSVIGCRWLVELIPLLGIRSETSFS